MADPKRISELDAAGTIDGSELVELVQSGDSVQATVTDVLEPAMDAAGGVASDLSVHGADTTSVHGITDTSTLYRAGGTDVAIADGGTGASSAATAFDNLKQAATDSATGVSELATMAEVLACTDAGRVLTPAALATLMAAVAGGGTGPTGCVAATAPRGFVWTNQAAHLVSGTLRLTGLWLPASLPVNNIFFQAATTASPTPTNWWMGLFDVNRAILRLTADQTTTAIAANVPFGAALTSQFITTYTGFYYLGCMVNAGTVPSIAASASAVTAAHADPPILTGNTSNTGLTTPASLGAGPAGAITVAGGLAYAYVT